MSTDTKEKQGEKTLMQLMNNVISIRNDILKNMTSNAKKYFDAIAAVITRENPKQYDDFNNLTNMIKKLLSDSETTIKDIDINNAAAAITKINIIYKMYHSVDEYINVLTEIFSNRLYFAKMSISMSQTFLSGVQLYKTEALKQIKFYNTDTKKIDAELFENVVKTFEQSLKSIILDIIPKEFENNNFNKFLIFLVNYIHDKLNSEEKSFLVDIVKKTKLKLLNSTILTPESINAHPQQQFCITGDLVPITLFKSIENTLEDLRQNDIIKKHDIKFDKDFISGEISTILIYKNIGNNYEYNIDPLINKSYVVENGIKPGFALNKKFIKQLNTIAAVKTHHDSTINPSDVTQKTIKTQTDDAKIVKNLIVTTPNNTTKFIIIEIWNDVNGKIARLLGTTHNTPIISYPECKFLFEINSLYINYNKILTSQSNWEEIKFDAIKSNYDDEQTKTIDYSQFKERLRENLHKFTFAQLQLCSETGEPTEDSIRDIINKIAKSYEDIIYNTFKKITSTPLILSDSEFIISRLNKVQNISSKFVREFNNRFISYKFDADLFKNNKELIDVELVEILDKINKNIIDQFDNNKIWNHVYDVSMKEVYIRNKLL